MRKSAFCICENKGAETAKLISAYTDSTNPLLHKFQASSHLLWLYSPVCVGAGQNPRKPVFSQRGSYVIYTVGHYGKRGLLTTVLVYIDHYSVFIINPGKLGSKFEMPHKGLKISAKNNNKKICQIQNIQVEQK